MRLPARSRRWSGTSASCQLAGCEPAPPLYLVTDKTEKTMAELINLRAVRKRAKRQQADERANASRAVHGQPKHVRTLDKTRRAKADRDLDHHLIDKGDSR